MLIEKMTVNVGEDTAIYVELHDINTPESELKYGDCKYNSKNEAEVWYGKDEGASMQGWQVTPWAEKNVTGVILAGIHNDNTRSGEYIYRVMNNDIDFDEAAYVATLVGENDE